jgi:hypothetical protein
MSVNVKTTIKTLERERAKIAASRDRLRDIEGDIQGLRQDCDEAVDDLERAIDALSRLQ